MTNRAGGSGGFDLWMATRDDQSIAWSDLVLTDWCAEPQPLTRTPIS